MVNEEALKLLKRLKTADRPVSGEALARSLGISRVALWKRVESLRDAGYSVTAGHSGYRLIPNDKPLPWEFPGDEDRTFYFETLESTMDEAFRLGLAGVQDAAVVAEHQTSGRGRSDHRWESSGGDLLVTLLVRPNLPLSFLGALGLEALATLADTLNDLYGLVLTLKWPNDLMAGEQKVAGILVEACGGVEWPRFYTVGLGLNVRGLPSLERPVASMATLGRPHADRRAILSNWRTRLSHWTNAPQFHPDRWTASARTVPRLRDSVTTWETFDGRIIRGAPRGFDRAGSLLVSAGSHTETLRYGEAQSKGVVS